MTCIICTCSYQYGIRDINCMPSHIICITCFRKCKRTKCCMCNSDTSVKTILNNFQIIACSNDLKKLSIYELKQEPDILMAIQLRKIEMIYLNFLIILFLSVYSFIGLYLLIDNNLDIFTNQFIKLGLVLIIQCLLYTTLEVKYQIKDYYNCGNRIFIEKIKIN